MACCTIPTQAPLEVETGPVRAVERCRCQGAGPADLNLGTLVSGKQKHSDEGTLTSPRPVERRANFGNSQAVGHQITSRAEVRDE